MGWRFGGRRGKRGNKESGGKIFKVGVEARIPRFDKGGVTEGQIERKNRE